MKKFYTLIAFIAFAGNISYSQNYCGSDRYDKEVFANFTKTADVTYGQNVTFSGSNQTLKLDVYVPTGDTASVRPLIIWVHGGSFIGGTKADPDVVAFSQKFARRGYVTASIDYRLFYYPLNDAAQAKKAVMRAVQDLKAAVRFFRKNAYTTNTYKIDTNNIIVGGSSAGAFTALHLAYLNTEQEFAAEIDTTGLGGLEGNSGNPGYLSTVHAVVNLCGALGNANYLVPGDIPLVSMHGTADATVPYGHAPIPQVPSLMVDGSYEINQKADDVGIANSMYTWFGADHTPYVTGGNASTQAAYMDTTVRFVSNFLYQLFGCMPCDTSPSQNTFIKSPQTVYYCQGDSIQLMSDYASSYLWSNGNTMQSIFVSSPGSYSVTATNSCGLSVSTVTTVAVNTTLPPVPVISIDGSKLSSSSLMGNQWYFNGNKIFGATSQYLYPNQNGNYMVVVTINGCSTSSDTFFLALGQEELFSGNTIKIYPNPNNGKFTVFNSQASAYNLFINNILGEVIYSSTVKSPSATIDLNAQPTGIYFLRISSGNKEETRKIVLY